MSVARETEGRPKRAHDLLLLLASLIVVLIIAPMFEQFLVNRVIMSLGLNAIFLVVIYAHRRRRNLLIPGILFALISLPLSWSTLFMDHTVLFVANCVLEATFFVVAAGLLLGRVMRRHLATVDSVFGAVCVYLLLGLAWAMLYWGIERVDQTAFDFDARRVIEQPLDGIQVTVLSEFIYFSFVTMSTLGYGDVFPQSPLAQTLAWMQSVTGKFYLAVLVARFVSLIPLERARE